MTSTDTMPPPLHHLESQPDNLMASSDVVDSSESPPTLLNGFLDQEKTPLPSHPASNVETTNGTEGHVVIPPLQPESRPVKDNKAVPWYDSNLHSSLASDFLLVSPNILF